ncbi:MAG: DNA-directed RNA polymerase subunit beta [Dehalococcoidia bacterium]|jgi:DNA-directed RNA polymerase subunit beta
MSISIAAENNNLPVVKSKNYARLPQVLEIPNLIQVQLDSFRWFMEEGIKDLLQEVSPIKDFTGGKMELSFTGYEFRPPTHDVANCRERDMSYQSNLYVRASLLIKETGEIKEQEVFLGEIPLMTENGTFIISGAERVVVNQLIRSPGVYFTLVTEDSGRRLCNAKLIPEHGAWLEFETSGKDVIWAKIDGRRKIGVTTLLRAISGEGDPEDALNCNTDEELLELFKVDDDNPEHKYISTTIDKEPESIRTKKESLIDIYKKLRPGEPPDGDSAKSLIINMFFHPRRYDLGRIGRFKLNKRLEYAELGYKVTSRALKPRDLVEIIRKIIQINNEKVMPDDIDHLGNRRVRTTGHLIQNQFRVGLIRLERTIKERMSLQSDDPTPTNLINNRPIIASMREFFGGSQLSQFMDQTNPLAELTHKRRLSAMGPGGLSRERAGFDVRDVHHSHYGKICPIETPEGPNIGLIGSLATYARIDGLGFIETPYRKVYVELSNTSEMLPGRMLRQDVLDSKKKPVAAAGTLIDESLAKKIAALPSCAIKIVPYVSGEIEYFTADRETNKCIAQANAPLNARDEFMEERVGAIRSGKYVTEPPEKIDYMDVSPKQVFSVTTALIPFLEHDDANRALMGSNMQRQGVPLVKPEAPLIGTGMESEVAKYSGQVVYAAEKGEVVAVDSKKITVKSDGRKRDYNLTKFYRTNQGTCINQRPVVRRGDIVTTGQVIADGAATQNGELALGQNVLCAFMTWRGYNFEDAIIISERLVKQDKFTSIHIEKYEVEARETKLGKEEITKDIPNVGEESLRDLDEFGVIRVGAEVGPGDILVGKITPKGETELTAEEKLLRAIFGEKAREVKDTSLRVPHGEGGKVIEVTEFNSDNHADLPANVIKLVRVWIAQRRKISVGDKMAGRHGNKGVISIILPEEDMPFMPDGRPVDIVLNPIGVPSRMNIGQILETHLGLAADIFGERVINPIFDGADTEAVEDALGKAWIVRRAREEGVINQDRLDDEGLALVKKWLSDHVINADKVFDESGKYHGEARRASLILWLEKEIGGKGAVPRDISKEELDEKVEAEYMQTKIVPPTFGKIQLRDGKTGELFDQPVTVGIIYMMKLIHLVDDKVHARSTGPYSLITQQPLGGKAQFGGQRFGEMEVWALEAYGASHTLQELLTVKSDDVQGRAKAYEALVKGEDVLQPGVPESFKVLFMELRSLGLAVELLNEEDQSINLFEDKKKMGGLPKALR